MGDEGSYPSSSYVSEHIKGFLFLKNKRATCFLAEQRDANFDRIKRWQIPIIASVPGIPSVLENSRQNGSDLNHLSIGPRGNLTILEFDWFSFRLSS
jgi:hypothetical protein